LSNGSFKKAKKAEKSGAHGVTSITASVRLSGGGATIGCKSMVRWNSRQSHLDADVKQPSAFRKCAAVRQEMV